MLFRSQFVNLIETKVKSYIVKYNIKNRRLCYPTIFHWGHAERTMFNSANERHRNVWSNWKKQIN